MNRYYPVFLNIKNKNCLVVGGGRVAYRKIMQLVKSGANVKVVAPSVIEPIELLSKKGRVKIIRRAYRTSDLNGVSLVYAATNDNDVNKKIFNDTRTRHILTNIVDAPAYCDFIMPALIKKGNIVVAISTEGRAPYASVLIKKRIATLLTPEYVKLINTIIKIRGMLLEAKRSGVNIDIEDALKKIPVRRLERYIKKNDLKSLRQYIRGFQLLKKRKKD